MIHETALQLAMQTVVGPIVEELQSLLHKQVEQTIAHVIEWMSHRITPAGNFRLENDLASISREGNRLLLESIFNQLDPELPADTPARIESDGTEYRRREIRTPNRNVATLFGTITVFRYAYRPCEELGKCIFPLQESLGLVEGCTPALAERAARLGGRAGATQRDVLQSLRRDNNVILGTQRLRNVWDSVATFTEPLRCAAQARQVCDWLQKAFTHDTYTQDGIVPTLAVGRDGITVAKQEKAGYEVASCGTISVYAGKKRLGTVYLGHVPEPGQPSMTEELLALSREILTQWHATGERLPQLSYVSDCGELEEAFYTDRLSRMRHPVTKRRLSWQRTVDFYHTAQRLTTIAEALNLDEASAKEWSRKMRVILKGRKGVSRVLHSAAALAKSRGFKNDEKQKEYATACNYLRKRSKWMQYDMFRERGLPIGSGVTEAGCKTLFTQRVKQSGMRWKHAGMQTVLNLRMLVLSGIWDAVYAESLERQTTAIVAIAVRTQPVVSQQNASVAA